MLFNTHGESMGRGCHPASLLDRLRYLAPDQSRAAFVTNGIAVKEESSFQGGDGYLYFLTPELAFATVCRVVESTLGPAEAREPDPVYADPSFASEFFAVVTEEFTSLVDDPDYSVLLGAFGRNLTDSAGSRPVARQHEYRAGLQEITHPSQIRAIANNTILQQMGFLANTIDGVGRAASQDAERFRFMLTKSPRFRQMMAMVETAMRVSDPDVFGAYLESFDPGMWLARSGHTRNPVRRQELRLIARQVETTDIHARLERIRRRLQGDYLLLREALAEAQTINDVSGAAPDEDDRREIALLHALRLSMIHRLYFLASHIPAFTPARRRHARRPAAGHPAPRSRTGRRHAQGHLPAQRQRECRGAGFRRTRELRARYRAHLRARARRDLRAARRLFHDGAADQRRDHAPHRRYRLETSSRTAPLGRRSANRACASLVCARVGRLASLPRCWIACADAARANLKCRSHGESGSRKYE